MTFTIQADWDVLALEDAPERIAWFKERIAQAVYCATADEAIRCSILPNISRFIPRSCSSLDARRADNAIVQGDREGSRPARTLSGVIRERCRTTQRVRMSIPPRWQTGSNPRITCSSVMPSPPRQRRFPIRRDSLPRGPRFQVLAT